MTTLTRDIVMSRSGRDPEVAELVHLADTQGLPGMYRWVKNRVREMSAPTLESIYLELKLRLTGVAFAFAYCLPNHKLPAPAAGDLARERTSNPGLWLIGLAHILSKSIVERARGALDAGDVLCGLQRHYCAGSGPTTVMFTSFSDFEQHLRATRAGDDFMLASLRQLSERGLLLKPTPDDARRLLSANPRDDFFLVRINPPPATIETLWEGRLDEENMDHFFYPTEGLFLVPFTWEQEFFIDAKMPNEKGEIPLGGAY